MAFRTCVSAFVFRLISLILMIICADFLIIKEADQNGDIYVQWGDNLAITCAKPTLSFDTAIMEWFIPSSPNEPIVSGEKAYSYWQDEVNMKSLILVIRSTNSGDSGKYTCRMGRQEGNKYLEMDRAEVNVIVRKSIVATDCPKEQWVPILLLDEKGVTNKDDNLLTADIRCIIQAFPAPTIHWRFKDKQITTGPKYIITNAGITILNPVEDDAGIYTAIARQPQQTAVFDLRVSVYSRPRITSGPNIIGPFKNAVVSGHEAYIQCLASGKPPPTIRWYREQDPQTELQIVNAQNFFVNINSRLGLLRIVKAKYPDDSGVYICRAIVSVPTSSSNLISNEHIIEAKLQINVILPPTLIPLTTMHQFVDIGDSVTVQCKVRATYLEEFYFQRLYSNIKYIEGVQPFDHRIHVWKETDPVDPLNHNLYLTIQNTTSHDTWNYTCYAANIGQSCWWNTTIKVMHTPQFLPRPNIPEINELNQLRFGWRDYVINLTCMTYGMPHPTWTWYRRGEQILTGMNMTFVIISYDYWNYSQSWLQIKPCLFTEHFVYDNYECRATNIKGTNSSVVQFRKASIPGQPILTDYVVTQSTLTLHIIPPLNTGGMPCLAYELIYTAVGCSAGWYGPVTIPINSSNSHSKTKFELTGLVGDTGYQLQLAARSIVGSGTPYSFSVQTSPSTRPGPVEVINSGWGIYSYGFVLNWIPPLNGGSPILGYRIRVRPVQNDDILSFWIGLKTTVIPMGSWQTYEPYFNNPYLNYYHLAPLKPDQTYQVIIEAWNRYGYSLDGISTTEYKFIDRIPRVNSTLLYYKSNELIKLKSFYQLNSNFKFNYKNFKNYSYPNLVPIWCLIRTSNGDEWDQPPHIFGHATILYPSYLSKSKHLFIYHLIVHLYFVYLIY